MPESSWGHKPSLSSRFVEKAQRDKIQDRASVPSSTVHIQVWQSLSIFENVGVSASSVSSHQPPPPCSDLIALKIAFFFKWLRCVWKIWFLSAGERAVTQTQDSLDLPIQAGTGGPGKPEPMSLGPDTLTCLALMRRLGPELPRGQGERVGLSKARTVPVPNPPVWSHSQFPGWGDWGALEKPETYL